MPRKRQTTKSKIVKAAWNLFYKKGYHATTIDDIITASRTSKGSFYHYFKGKDALLGSLAYLFDDKYEELVASMDPTLSAADKLLYLNYELFLMIETSVDMELLTLLYSSQLTTRDQRALLDDSISPASGKSSKLHRTVGSLLLNAPQTNLFISTRCMNAH